MVVGCVKHSLFHNHLTWIIEKWQMEHLWSWAHYLFMQICMMGAMNDFDWWNLECAATCFIIVTTVEIHRLILEQN